MTISDDRSVAPAPPATPPFFVRRHPIVAGFGVLSGLSLFSALWPVSAVVIGVAVAGHATGLDRAALLLAERLVARIGASAHRRAQPEPEPAAPAPSSPEPAAPVPAAPRREAHGPAARAARVRREPHAQVPAARRPVRRQPASIAERHAGSRIDGPGL
jgi:hypothetical protein